MAESNGFAPEFLESLTQLIGQNERLLEQNEKLTAHTQELPKIANEIALLRGELVTAVINRIPEGSIPLSTHKDLLKEQAEFVKGQNRWWAIMIGVALGIVQLGPAIDRFAKKSASEAVIAEHQAEQVTNYYKDEKKSTAPVLVVK